MSILIVHRQQDSALARATVKYLKAAGIHARAFGHGARIEMPQTYDGVILIDLGDLAPRPLDLGDCQA